MQTNFHLRARAVVYHNGKFLVVHGKTKGNAALQGGHIESGESIVTTLKREMIEECGRECEVKEYLGAIENKWIEDDVEQWEINHIFHVEILDLDSKLEIISAEENLIFSWITINEFEAMNLLPLPLRPLMKAWAEGDKKTWWASTF